MPAAASGEHEGLGELAAIRRFAQPAAGRNEQEGDVRRTEERVVAQEQLGTRAAVMAFNALGREQANGGVDLPFAIGIAIWRRRGDLPRGRIAVSSRLEQGVTHARQRRSRRDMDSPRLGIATRRRGCGDGDRPLDHGAIDQLGRKARTERRRRAIASRSSRSAIGPASRMPGANTSSHRRILSDNGLRSCAAIIRHITLVVSDADRASRMVRGELWNSGS